MSENKTIIYPHAGVVVFGIIKSWAILAILIGIIEYTLAYTHIIPKNIIEYIGAAEISIIMLGIFMAVQKVMSYTNTYIELEKDAIVVRKGWIPNTTETIFWVNIKDVNSSSSILESILGSGSLSLYVTIKNNTFITKIRFIPQQEKLRQLIQDRIGVFAENTKQVTFT